MDITSIKHLILTNLKTAFNFKTIWEKFKEAMKLPYAKTYMAVALVLSVLFFAFTFPYDMMLRSRLKGLEKTMFKSVYIGELNFSPFDIIEMNKLTMLTQGGSEINIKNMEIDLSLLKLMIQKDIKGSLKIDGFKYESQSTQLNLNLSANIFLDYKSFSDIPQGGNFNPILIENATLKITNLPLPDAMGGLPFSLPLIKINSIKIEADITNNKLNIKNLRIFGKDLNGSMTGSIALQKNFMASGLDLKLIINADTPVLDGYRDFLSKYINDRNQLVLGIKGSLLMPRFEPGQAEAGGGGPAPKYEHPMDKLVPVH
jgi:hypothetical protein